MRETWKPIPGYEGIYEASDLGRVRSHDRVLHYDGWTRSIKGRVLRPAMGSHGYLSVGLYVNTNHDRRLVHRVVVETFIGPIPQGMEVCHADGNKTNNALSNLRVDTPLGNAKDKYKHGTVMRGEDSAASILTERDVVSIREEVSKGVSRREIAHKHGITPDHVGAISRGIAWGHVGGPLQPRQNCKGEGSTNAKLTESAVREIRNRYCEGGITMIALAAEYGVSRKGISKVLKRQTWAHVR